MILRTTPDGRVTRLRDVARVEMGRKQDVSCKLDGYPSAGLFIVQLPDANALDVAERVRAKMDELAKDFPDDLAYGILLRHHALHQPVHRRGLQGAARRGAAGGIRGAVVPAKLAVGGHSADRRAGGHHRHVCRAGRVSASASTI